MSFESPFQRTALLFGEAAMQKLSESRVAVFGVGGVGGHCAEALARCGVGAFLLVDMDYVSATNINRQAVALHSTVGRLKVDVMRERILDINPAARVDTIAGRFTPDDDLGAFDRPVCAVVDAVDQVNAKVELARRAQDMGIPCVSCMGAGNKLDPSRFETADLFETSVCPLSRAVRRLAKERGVLRLRVVYSKEPPLRAETPPGSVAFVTASAGLVLAGEAVRLLLGDLFPGSGKNPKNVPRPGAQSGRGNLERKEDSEARLFVSEALASQ